MREVHVVINGGGDVSVVFNEFLEGNLKVALVVVHHIVVLLEGLQELS